MKTKISAIFIFLLCWTTFPSNGQQTYYYYSGSKKYLEYSTKKLYIKFRETASAANKRDILSALPFNKRIDNITSPSIINYAIVELLESKDIVDFQNILLSINNNENVMIALPYLQSFDGKTLIGLTEIFLVKLYTPEDYYILEQLAKETNTIVIKQNEFAQRVYELQADKNSKGNALEMANYFYENGNFEFSTPDMIYKLQMNCATDSLFPHQWGLQNTGQSGGIPGVDINICEAWEITKGCSNIKVAVIDNGVDLNHPDLKDNLLQGYDVTGFSYGGGYEDEDDHGTNCAGIIAANNNTIGTCGVAPNCKIIPIRTPSYNIFDQYGSASKIADGINKAVELGADILSNSWSIDPLYAHDAIDNAINAATTLGRNGLGCVVVCSSSNKNTYVQYPASYSKTIAVGAIDRCGIRAGKENITGSCDPWTTSDGSCYGYELDFVAPGSKIYTTDIVGPHGINSQHQGSYDPSFGGTSAACPFVAGVAALALSVNSNLTYEQVRKYIALGCEKVGNYFYNYCEKYGIWDFELGYGKVNAFKTLQYLLGSERHMNNLTGSNTETTNSYKWVLVTPIDGLAAGTYFVQRYKMEKTIYFSQTERIIATSDGVSPDNPNLGNSYTNITYLSDTSATLTSYVYELFDILGQSIGFKPVSPSNFRFNVGLYKKMEKDLYLKNFIIKNQTNNYEAINYIETKNVAISGNSNVNFHAGNSVVWKEGTTISPGGNGIVRAYIEPFILGECEPNSYLTPNSFQQIPAIFEEFMQENRSTTFDFILTPNPTTAHSFSIHPIGEAEMINSVQVYNLAGQTLYKCNTYSEEAIILPNTARGVHIVRITTPNEIVVKKILLL